MSKPRRVAIQLDLALPYKRHAELFAGTQEYAQEHGWESILDEYIEDTLPAGRVKSIPYDGIISRATRELAERTALLGIPVVNVWRSSPVRDRLPSVYSDFEAIGRLRAEHLLSRGFQRFAGLTSTTFAHKLEMKSFRSVLADAGHSCPVATVPLPGGNVARWRKTEQVIATCMESWQPPIGVYVGSDGVGRTLAQVCLRHGWRVPEDVAIIAGENEETLCNNPRPSLTSVELGHRRIGYEAARLLDRLMDGEEPPAEPILLPPVGLVVRESTDFFAVDDPLVAEALAFIAAKSHLPIGPSDVAEAVITELRSLQRRFRKYLDRPIADEIRRVRLERAKRELTQSKRPVAEISRAVGFGDTMRMYQIFRRELGVTPSDYRRERQVQIEK